MLKVTILTGSTNLTHCRYTVIQILFKLDGSLNFFYVLNAYISSPRDSTLVVKCYLYQSLAGKAEFFNADMLDKLVFKPVSSYLLIHIRII